MANNMFIIREPIWNGHNGNEAIGLASSKLSDLNYIQIAYTDANSMRPFPNKFTITRERAITYPIKLRKGTRLHIIPIKALTLLASKL